MDMRWLLKPSLKQDVMSTRRPRYAYSLLRCLGSIAPSKFKLGINWTGSTAWTRSVSRSRYLRCTVNFWVAVSQASCLYFVVRVCCRREKVHIRYLICWWVSCADIYELADRKWYWNRLWFLGFIVLKVACFHNILKSCMLTQLHDILLQQQNLFWWQLSK